jgi:DNA-binding FrmR family transcriptional regulator
MIVNLKKRAVHRTKILEGQIKGLQKMIDNEAYCMDILTQSLAIQRSLASLDRLVLENHLRTHIVEMMASGDKNHQEKALVELLELYKLHNIKGQAGEDNTMLNK